MSLSARCRACVWVGVLVSAAVHAAIAAMVLGQRDAVVQASHEQSVPVALVMFADEQTASPLAPEVKHDATAPQPAEKEAVEDLRLTPAPPLPEKERKAPKRNEFSSPKRQPVRTAKRKSQATPLAKRESRRRESKGESQPARATPSGRVASLHAKEQTRPPTPARRAPRIPADPHEASAKSSGLPSQKATSALERQYLISLRRAISARQRYPMDARRARQRGVVTVSFVLQADGRIGQIRLTDGSGVASLDSAALDALRRLGRFRPIPAVLERPSWTLRVPIRFDLKE